MQFNMIVLRPYGNMFLSLLLFFSCYFTASSQNEIKADPSSDFVFKINRFGYLYPQEKAYLHFDNTGYFKGETIWFKAYVVMAENNLFSPMSKVLYVELLTPEGEVVKTQKLKIENGQARGGLVLDETLFAGYYEVRAYTRCALNFDEQAVFSRVFPVYNAPKRPGDYGVRKMFVRGKQIERKNLRKPEKKAKPEKIGFSFFPEGGNLVAGIANRVAFKATDEEGKDLDIQGKVYNDVGEEITSFESLHLGMGSFMLYPENNKYVVKINHNNREYTFDLPPVMSSGYVMRVENMHPDLLTVQVEKTPDLPVEMLGITLACRGKVYAFKSFEPDQEGRYALRLPKKDLPSGVIQITLFTAHGEVLAQRQAFVNRDMPFVSIKAANIPARLKPFDPVPLDFEVRNNAGDPVETTFSLSVRDESTDLKWNHADNILYNLLLSSDLKGYIKNPACYFESDDNEHRLALDLLMQVQGWTRYPWKPSAGLEVFDVKHGIEKSLMIEGQVLSLNKKQALKDVEVLMWMTSHDGWSQQGNCLTDQNGRFNFALADITGLFDLNLSVKKKGKAYASKITLDRNFSPAPLAFNFYETNPGGMTEDETDGEDVQIEETGFPERRLQRGQEEVSMSYVLPDVDVKEKMIPRQVLLQQLLRFAVVHYDVAREMDKYRDEGGSETGDVLDFLMKIDPGFSYMEVPVVSMDNPVTFQTDIRYKNKKIPILIDGWQLENLPYDLRDLSVGEIEHIVITNSDINIITNKDGVYRRERAGFRNTYYEGFAPAVEFYAPDYSLIILSEPDVRRTLYWNPDVKTDSLGKASVRFYNNGTCREVIISAEGLTEDGLPVLYEDSEK